MKHCPLSSNLVDLVGLVNRHLSPDFVPPFNAKQRNEERQTDQAGTHPQGCAVGPHLGPVVFILLVVATDRSRHDTAEGQANSCPDLERGIDEPAGCRFDAPMGGGGLQSLRTA